MEDGAIIPLIECNLRRVGPMGSHPAFQAPEAVTFIALPTSDHLFCENNDTTN